jgi:hypothetical protein
MSFHEDLENTLVHCPESIARFGRHLPSAWIAQVFGLSGTATLRKRRLPLEQVVWIVIGMALMRDRSIEDVVAKLDLALPSTTGKTVALSSIAESRQHLGATAMADLFAQTASAWAHAKAAETEWHGLAVYAIDGSTQPVPDTPENRAVFGGQTNGGTQDSSAYPMIRMVVLQSARTHLLAAARTGPYVGSSELSLTDELITEIPAYSVTLVDRNFLCGRFLQPLRNGAKERHFVTRAKKNTVMHEVAVLGPGDRLVELNHSADDRKRDPSLPKRWTARAISYRIDGGTDQILLTSLLDAKAFPAAEIIELYHERWEVELGFDEKKTKMLGGKPALRSKTADGVRQELWGVLLAYNLIRLEMCEVADEAGVPPLRISFIAALRLICDEWMWFQVTKPGAFPDRMANLRRNLKLFILPERRRERRYPRVLKVVNGAYPRKKRVTAAKATK